MPPRTDAIGMVSATESSQIEATICSICILLILVRVAFELPRSRNSVAEPLRQVSDKKQPTHTDGSARCAQRIDEGSPSPLSSALYRLRYSLSWVISCCIA